MAMRITSTLPTHLTGGSFLRYEVGDNVRMQMPDAFWGRLQREYGRIRYVQSRGEAAWSKCKSWQRSCSAPVPPQGVPGGSGQLSTPRKKSAH